MNLNVKWSPPPSGETRAIRKTQINVAESGIVSPGSYAVEIRGNVIYWDLKDNK